MFYVISCYCTVYSSVYTYETYMLLALRFVKVLLKFYWLIDLSAYAN